MVVTTQPDIIAPDYGYSLVPFTLLTGSIRLGVAAAIDEETYNTGSGDVSPEITQVSFLVTDSAAAEDTLVATDRSVQTPSTYDGGADALGKIVDWNVPIDLSTMADGWFTVVATVSTNDGQTKVLSTWTAYNNDGGTFTPRTIYVRAAGNDANDGLTAGNAVATIGHAVEISIGGDTIDLENGATYNTIDFSATENSAGSNHWITFDCSGGTATLTGTQASNTGLGLHKHWALGPNIIAENYRPSIQGGAIDGIWWLNGCEYRGTSQINTTPFTNFGLNPARTQFWYATGCEIHTCTEFDTLRGMTRGVTMRNFAGDSFLKISRTRIGTCAYNTTLHDIIQSGGTHADIVQIADTVTADDVGGNLYIQGLYVADSEAALFQLSNVNQPASQVVLEDCVLHNDGLGANASEVSGVTNNNLTQEINNLLFRHCTFVDQSQRWDPTNWDHVRYEGCVLGSIISNISGGGATGDQADLDASDTLVNYSVYTSLAGFTSIPGANNVVGAAIFEDIADTNTVNTLDFRLATGSPGLGILDGVTLYKGRPDEINPGVWARTANGGDFTATIALASGGGGGGPDTVVGTARFANRASTRRLACPSTVLTLAQGAVNDGDTLVDGRDEWVDWTPNRSDGADAPEWPDGSYREIRIWIRAIELPANSVTEVVVSRAAATPPAFNLDSRVAASIGNFISSRAGSNDFNLTLDIDPDVPTRSGPRNLGTNSHGTLTWTFDGHNVQKATWQVRDVRGNHIWTAWIEFYGGGVPAARIDLMSSYSNPSNPAWVDTLQQGYQISGTGCWPIIHQEAIKADNPGVGGIDEWARNYGGAGRVHHGQGCALRAELWFLDPDDRTGWTALDTDTFDAMREQPRVYGISDDWRTREGYGPRGNIPPQLANFTSFAASRVAEANRSTPQASQGAGNYGNVGGFYHDIYQGNIEPSGTGSQFQHGHAPFLAAVMTGQPHILERVANAVAQENCRPGWHYENGSLAGTVDGEITSVDKRPTLLLWGGIPFNRDPNTDQFGKSPNSSPLSGANSGRTALVPTRTGVASVQWLWYGRQHYTPSTSYAMALLTGDDMAHHQCAHHREHLRSLQPTSTFVNQFAAYFEASREVGRCMRSMAWLYRISPSAPLLATITARINTSLSEVGLSPRFTFEQRFAPNFRTSWQISQDATGPGLTPHDLTSIENDNRTLAIGPGGQNDEADGILYWEEGMMVDGLACVVDIDPTITRAAQLCLQTAENCVEFGFFEDLQARNAGGFYNVYHALKMIDGNMLPATLLPPIVTYEGGGGRGPAFPHSSIPGQAWSNFRVYFPTPRWAIPAAEYCYENTANVELRAKAAKILQGYYQTYFAPLPTNTWPPYGDTWLNWVSFSDDPIGEDYGPAIAAGSDPGGVVTGVITPPIATTTGGPGGGGMSGGGGPGTAEPIAEPEPSECSLTVSASLTGTVVTVVVGATGGTCDALEVFAARATSPSIPVVVATPAGANWALEFAGLPAGAYVITAQCIDGSGCLPASTPFTYEAVCNVSIAGAFSEGVYTLTVSSTGNATAYEGYIATDLGPFATDTGVAFAVTSDTGGSADFSGLAAGTYFIRVRSTTPGACFRQEAAPVKVQWSGTVPTIEPGTSAPQVGPRGSMRIGRTF